MANDDWDYVKPDGTTVPAASADDEWIIQPPKASAPSPSAPPAVSQGEDIGKGFVGGVARGTTGLVGTGGTIGDLVRRGATWAGVPESVINAGAMAAKAIPMSTIFTGPSGADVRHAVEERTGKFYEPTTTLGKYASTIGEFAPAAATGGGSATARVLGTVVPAVASEAAGQATAGTSLEPWARAAGGVMGGVLGGKAITLAPPATLARQKAAGVLDNEGIAVTAGDRTGSLPVRRLEDIAGVMPMSAGRMQEIRQGQLTDVNRAFTERTFDRSQLSQRGVPRESNLPDTDVFSIGKQSLKDVYNDLSARNAARADPRLINDMQAAVKKYEENVLPTQRAGGKLNIDHNVNDIVDRFIAGQGQMPGEVYQSVRSRLGKQAKGVKDDSALSGALLEIRGALDRNMQRNLSPADKAAWAENNLRYANMKQLEPLVAKGGEFMTPAGIAQAVRSRRTEQAAAGSGNLDELAKAANLIVKPLPSSGTGERTAWLKPTNFLNPMNYLARAVISRPGQAYLSNQVAPMSRRDLIARALVQQAASQPGPQ